MREPTYEQRIDSSWSDRWRTLKFLWWNTAALAVVLAGIMAVADNGSIAIFDEAVYATQATALSEGSWVAPRGAIDIDPLGLAEPLIDAVPVGDGSIAYSRHPLYPLLIVPWIEFGGYSAALLLSVAGVVGAAVAASFIARRLDRAYGVPALWLAGLGSPLVADALVLWAHSLIAAAGGLLFLEVLRVLDGRRSAVHAAIAAIATAFTVMIRSEGALFVGAVGVALLVNSVLQRDRRERWRNIAVGVLILVVGVGAYLFDGWWAEAIGGRGYGTNVATWVSSEGIGAVGALWSSVLRPGRGSTYDATELIAIASILLFVGAVAVRVRFRWKSVPWVLAMMASACWIVALVTNSHYFWVSGLLPAFPALYVSAVLVGRSELAHKDALLSLGVFLTGGLGLILTIYSDGGAVEWGGRFFHVLLPPVIGLIVAVIDCRRQQFGRSEQRMFVLPVAALLVVPSLMAVQFIATGKAITAQHAAAVESSAARVDSPGHPPLVVVVLLNRDGSSRSLWSLRGRVDVLVPRQPGEFLRILNTTGARERGEVLLDTDFDVGLIEELLSVDSGATWRAERGTARIVGGRTLVVVRMVESQSGVGS